MKADLILRGGGGGRTVLSDINADLITAYRVIQRDPEPLIDRLRIHAARHGKDYYYSIRSQHDLADEIEIAARFIYLNKTCFNGLWRVNSRGRFNVPMGSYVNPAICQADELRACHVALRDAELRLGDFRELSAGEGDFVYFDPPYQPLDSASFTSYAKSGFGKNEQRALRDSCLRLHERGALVMLSNSDTPLIRALYAADAFRLEQVQAPRMVNCKPEARGPVNELLITNYWGKS